MALTKPRHAYTYGDYLRLEADAPTVRHEFVDLIYREARKNQRLDTGA